MLAISVATQGRGSWLVVSQTVVGGAPNGARGTVVHGNADGGCGCGLLRARARECMAPGGVLSAVGGPFAGTWWLRAPWWWERRVHTCICAVRTCGLGVIEPAALGDASRRRRRGGGLRASVHAPAACWRAPAQGGAAGGRGAGCASRPQQSAAGRCGGGRGRASGAQYARTPRGQMRGAFGRRRARGGRRGRV